MNPQTDKNEAVGLRASIGCPVHPHVDYQNGAQGAHNGTTIFKIMLLEAW